MTECVNCAKFKGCDLSSPNVNECADYKETLTNEEYLHSCNTEQLAEELLAWWVDGADTYTQFGLFQGEIDEAKERIVEWLKQPKE